MLWSFFDATKWVRRQLYKWLYNPYLCKGLQKCGTDVFIERGSYFSGRKHIEMGNHVYVGPFAIIYSTIANVYIGNHVTIGPRLVIITGDHRTDMTGCYMQDVKEKLQENDADVIIDDDVWIGANVTILKGIKIGKGSVIAAGSLINKNVPSMQIVAGVPAKVIRSRFSNKADEEKQKAYYEKYLDDTFRED